MKSKDEPNNSKMREADAKRSLTHKRPDPKTKPPTKRPSSSTNKGSKKVSK